MDEKPWAIDDLDGDDTADEAALSGPLGRLVEDQIDSGTVEFDVRKSITPSQPSIRPSEYAEGTTEHADDREG